MPRTFFGATIDGARNPPSHGGGFRFTFILARPFHAEGLVGLNAASFNLGYLIPLDHEPLINHLVHWEQFQPSAWSSADRKRSMRPEHFSADGWGTQSRSLLPSMTVRTSTSMRHSVWTVISISLPRRGIYRPFSPSLKTSQPCSFSNPVQRTDSGYCPPG